MLTLEGVVDHTDIFSFPGPNNKEKHLLKIWVKDPSTGKTLICDLPDNDPQYKDFVTIEEEKHIDPQKLRHHKIKVTIVDITLRKSTKDPTGYIINYEIENIYDGGPVKQASTFPKP